MIATEQKAEKAEKVYFNPLQYKRRTTRVVMVGPVGVGGEHPIRIQSMTTTPTADTSATVDQILRLEQAGCEIVRLTAPTIKEARNLENIKNELLKNRCPLPVVADIHFKPDAALEAASYVEKVRINPGNFSDSKAFRIKEYSLKQYQAELDRIEEIFTPLVLKLKRLRRALRIGTNHGSLSDRVMNRYGDTPLGMVESALEFVRVCRRNDFHDIVLSMKASNPKVMIEAYRLLAERMGASEMDYPFHLGVTEAGGGEEGRIKSAVGIGSLLEEGLGDTLRVSLTEEPEKEIPVARDLVERFSRPNKIEDRELNDLTGSYFDLRSPGSYARRTSPLLRSGPISLGGGSPIRVAVRVKMTAQAAGEVLALLEERTKTDRAPEILDIPYGGADFEALYRNFRAACDAETRRMSYWVRFHSGAVPSKVDFDADGLIYEVSGPLFDHELSMLCGRCKERNGLLVLLGDEVDTILKMVETVKGQGIPLLAGLSGKVARSSIHPWRRLLTRFHLKKWMLPLVLSYDREGDGVGACGVLGGLLCDGFGDVVEVSCPPKTTSPSTAGALDFSYNLFQACGNRITQTEFVSCPSCGRTLFDLQSTTERIKSKTGHLKGVKIAIMGCIVNGPGEMADADFGYVGGGPGKINLYVGKTCVEKSIPARSADQKLIDLIKTHGKWVDPS